MGRIERMRCEEAASREAACAPQEAEEIAALRRVLHTGAVLAPELITGRRQAARRAIQHVGSAGIKDTPDVFAGNADREISEPVMVEVAGIHACAKLVAKLLTPGHSGTVLFPE